MGSRMRITNTKQLKLIANTIREDVIKMLYEAKSGHSAGSIGLADIFTALYFNVLVLIVQAFLKVPALHALAPGGSEPPFLIAQGAALVLFVVLGIAAGFRFHPKPALMF